MFGVTPFDFVILALLALWKVRALRLLAVATIRVGVIVSVLGIGILYSLPPQPCSCMRIPFTRCTWTNRHLVTAKLDLKNLGSQQQIYFHETGRFSDDMQDLDFVPSSGSRVTIVAGESSWGARVEHAALEAGRGCAMFVGSQPPPGLDVPDGTGSGEIVCTE